MLLYLAKSQADKCKDLYFTIQDSDKGQGSKWKCFVD